MSFPKPEPREKTEPRPMKRSRINPISPRQIKRNRQLAKLKRELIAERGPYCEGQKFFQTWQRDFESRLDYTYSQRDLLRVGMAMGDCRGSADELHHVVKRSRQDEDRREDLALLCGPCHRFTESCPELATKIGLLRRAMPLHVRRVMGRAS